MQNILSVTKLNPFVLRGRQVTEGFKYVNYFVKYHTKSSHLKLYFYPKVLAQLSSKEATELSFIRRTIGVKPGSSTYDMAELISEKLSKYVSRLIRLLPDMYTDLELHRQYGNVTLHLPQLVLDMINYVISSKLPFKAEGSDCLFISNDFSQFIFPLTTEGKTQAEQFFVSEIGFINEISKILNIFGPNVSFKFSELGNQPSSYFDCFFKVLYEDNDTKKGIQHIEALLGKETSEDSYELALLLLPELVIDKDVIDVIMSFPLTPDDYVTEVKSSNFTLISTEFPNYMNIANQFSSMNDIIKEESERVSDTKALIDEVKNKKTSKGTDS